jgi:hypothetical protein
MADHMTDIFHYWAGVFANLTGEIKEGLSGNSSK